MSGGNLWNVRFCLLLEKKLYEWKYFWRKFFAFTYSVLTLKGIIRTKIFLALIYCVLVFVDYCKKAQTNENISGWNLLLVPLCLLLEKVWHEYNYLWRKFIASSFLFIILKSIISMKIFLAHIYCLFLFLCYCEKCHTNENMSKANLLLVSFSLIL